MNVDQIKKLVPELGDIHLFIGNTAAQAVLAFEKGMGIEAAQTCLCAAGAGWFQSDNGPVKGIQIDSLLPKRLSKEELRAVLLHEVGHIKCGHIASLEEAIAGRTLVGSFEDTEQEADMFSLEHGSDIIDLGNGIIKTLMCQLAQTAVAYKAIKGDEMSHARKTRYLRSTAVSHKARFRAFNALSNQF
jgi:hypothetical protein